MYMIDIIIKNPGSYLLEIENNTVMGNAVIPQVW